MTAADEPDTENPDTTNEADPEEPTPKPVPNVPFHEPPGGPQVIKPVIPPNGS